MTADMRPHIWPATPSLAATSSLHRLSGAGTDLCFLLFLDLFLEDSDQSSDLQLRLLSASTSNVTGNKRKAAEIFREIDLTSKLSHILFMPLTTISTRKRVMARGSARPWPPKKILSTDEKRPPSSCFATSSLDCAPCSAYWSP